MMLETSCKLLSSLWGKEVVMEVYLPVLNPLGQGCFGSQKQEGWTQGLKGEALDKDLL